MRNDSQDGSRWSIEAIVPTIGSLDLYSGVAVIKQIRAPNGRSPLCVTASRFEATQPSNSGHGVVAREKADTHGFVDVVTRKRASEGHCETLRVWEQLRAEPAAWGRRYHEYATFLAKIRPPSTCVSRVDDFLGAGKPDVVEHPYEGILGEPHGELVLERCRWRQILHVARRPCRELAEEPAFVGLPTKRERAYFREVGPPASLDAVRLVVEGDMRVDHNEAVAERGHIGEKGVGILEVVEEPERKDSVESTARFASDLHRVAQDERRSFNAEDSPYELALPDVEELAVDAQDLRSLKSALDREISLEAADVRDASIPEVAAKPLAHDAHDLPVRVVVIVARRRVHAIRQRDVVVPRRQ